MSTKQMVKHYQLTKFFLGLLFVHLNYILLIDVYRLMSAPAQIVGPIFILITRHVMGPNRFYVHYLHFTWPFVLNLLTTYITLVLLKV